ncbi:MAG TPA: ATP-binding protein, partial [Spirochaetales bacterium]|nr:ATP-binding protein [Spirochaetales bacterium]
ANERVLTLGCRYEGDFLTIIVRDSGTGMDKETQARIFGPFYSASGRGGTGLGLLIVRNIVEAHGGTLAFDSSPGAGTTFTLSLPKRA